MSERGYNGWSNYETWCVVLWIDNEESSYRYVRLMAREAWIDSEDSDSAGLSMLTRDDRFAAILAPKLREWIEGDAPELNLNAHGLYSDLMHSAMAEVDYHEIARSYLEDVRPEPPKRKTKRKASA